MALTVLNTLLYSIKITPASSLFQSAVVTEGDEIKHRSFLNTAFHHRYWPFEGLSTNSKSELALEKYVRTAGK